MDDDYAASVPCQQAARRWGASRSPPYAAQCRAGCRADILAETLCHAALRKTQDTEGCARGRLSATPLGPQLIEQRLGVLEIGGVKALGGPAVDRGQQLAGRGEAWR